MSQNGIAVTARDLTRRFGKNFLAVDHISFEVGAGQIYGFLGPNGAGKSTTIRMLCGIIAPTSGQGTVGGYDMSQRAYMLNRTGAGDGPLRCSLAASSDRPAFNPVLLLAGWDRADAVVEINGRGADRGDRFRTGLCRGLDRTDLVIWLALETTEPVDLAISPADQ